MHVQINIASGEAKANVIAPVESVGMSSLEPLSQTDEPVVVFKERCKTCTRPDERVSLFYHINKRKSCKKKFFELKFKIMKGRKWQKTAVIFRIMFFSG